jgi:hypothetical protein
MLTFVVYYGKLKPIILTLPKKDFPASSYKILRNNAKVDDDGNYVLHQYISRKNQQKILEESLWSSIINKIYSIVDVWNRPEIHLPDWCKNGEKLNNLDQIKPDDNEIFIIYEKIKSKL